MNVVRVQKWPQHEGPRLCYAEEDSENGDGGRDPEGLWWSEKAGTHGK